MSENDVRLPDYRNTFIMGAGSSNIVTDIGQSIAAGLPNIEGSAKIDNGGGGGAQIGLGSASGAFKGSTEAGSNKWTACEAGSSAKTSATLNFSASNSSPIYGNSVTVQPPAIKTIWCIQAKKTNNSSGDSSSNCPDESTIKGWIDEKIKNINNDVGGLSIGTIFSHVSKNPPAGAYLLDGQAITKEAYPDFYEYIINNQDNIRVITAEEYNNEIKQYKVCGAFVISENDVRLPTWNGYQTPLGNSVPVVGNGIALGLTNGEKYAGLATMNTYNQWTALSPYGYNYGLTVGDTSYSSPADKVFTLNQSVGVTEDSTKSGIIADTSDYAKDEFYWYIQVYNAVTELSTQESAQLSSQIQLKAQTDLANVTEPVQAFKDMVISWGIPDYSAGISILSGYVAPCSGYVVIVRGGGSSKVYLYIDGVQVDSNESNITNEGGSVCAFVGKGSTVTWSTGNITGATFFPLKAADR